MTTTIPNPAADTAHVADSHTADSRSTQRPAAESPALTLLAALRILLGFMFVWDFFDKTFGLGISTPPVQAWLAGASPTAGYLASLNGPAAVLKPLAGQPWVDWAFMLGMLALGAALMLGVALRAAAFGGTALLALLWVSALPTQNNPFVDQHVIFALALWILMFSRAGRTWGFGQVWEAAARQPRFAWLRTLG